MPYSGSNQPMRKVKVKIDLRFKPALKAGSGIQEAILQKGLPPGVLAQQIVELEVPINVSNAQLTHDTRFIMAVERARERLMDEMIDLKHEVIQETRT
jgi:hypothetical protein